MPTIRNSQNNREDLAKFFSILGFRKIAEIGVEQGEYSEILAKHNPNAKIYCIDAWKAYRGYRDHTRQEKLDRFYKITTDRLAQYDCEIIRKFSMDAVNDFRDRSLDAVYIDANHSYDSVMEDITEWAKKVRPGGVVAGHDYIKRKGQDQYYDVVQAVEDYTAAHGLNYIVWRGDKVPSWGFQKL